MSRLHDGVGGWDWYQETHDTGSGSARKRAAQLRKAGFKVSTSAMGMQVTSVGLVKLTMLTVHDREGREIPPIS